MDADLYVVPPDSADQMYRRLMRSHEHLLNLCQQLVNGNAIPTPAIQAVVMQGENALNANRAEALRAERQFDLHLAEIERELRPEGSE